MRHKMLAAFVAVAALSLTACSSDFDTPVGEKVQDTGVLKVGTEGTYPPYSYQDSDGRLTGYDVDVARAVGAHLGYRVEFQAIPWDSIFAGLQARRFDLVANQVAITAARQAKYDMSAPYTVSRGVVVTAADNHTITSLADLKGKKSAESATSNWADVAREAGAHVVSIEGFVQAIRLLKDGRVDATVNDNLAVAAYLKQSHDTGIKIAAQTGDTETQGFAALKDSGLMPKVDKALAELRADGTLKRISEKYFDADASGE